MGQIFDKEGVLKRLASADPQEILAGIREVVGQVNDPDICAVLLGFIGHYNEDIVVAATCTLCFPDSCDFDTALDLILDSWDQWSQRVRDEVALSFFHTVCGKYKKGKIYPRALAKYVEILDTAQPSEMLEVVLEGAPCFKLEETIPILIRRIFAEATTEAERRSKYFTFFGLLRFRTHTEETALALINALHIYDYPRREISHPMRGNCTPRVRQAIIELFASGKMAYSLEEFIENLHSDVREELGL